jgi:hypothetical protein
MTDNTAALAAIMARLNSFIGRAATFPTPSGPKVTGTLSEYRLGEERGGNVQVRFRECADWYEVSGFPTDPVALPPAEPRQIERGDA